MPKVKRTGNLTLPQSLERAAANIAKVSVGHFAWTVNDATHDRDGHTFEMICTTSNFLSNTLLPTHYIYASLQKA